ncbi:MAG: hypothetical protein ACYSWW_26425, partial [Planctomycetota bacterium]
MSKDAASQRFAGVAWPRDARMSASVSSVGFSPFQKAPSVVEITLILSQRGLRLTFLEQHANG